MSNVIIVKLSKEIGKFTEIVMTVKKTGGILETEREGSSLGAV